MSGERFDWLSDGIAIVLRAGTLIAMGIVGAGYLLGLVGGFEDGQRPLPELVASGGAMAIIGAGLFALTLLPAGVLVAASIGFARGRERGRLLTALGVLGLLVASLVAAALLGQAG